MADEKNNSGNNENPNLGSSGETIVEASIVEKMRTSYIEYAMSVIISRALPDVRDGLKPVHRRVLTAMNDLNLQPGRPYRKSAKITGDTTGNYHPHGTSAVYDTMVRMAQDFSLRYPQIDGQGNFGSVDGDRAAAERYTEARLTKFSTAIMHDLDKETVDFVPNYDGSRMMPSVMPSKVPNLLVNGADGIAVGMATKIPPHNKNEVCDGLIALLDNADIEPADMLQYVEGPDFPTGGIIHGRRGIYDYITTGRGRVVVRARTETEISDNGRATILVSELPYQVNKSSLIEKIANLVRGGVIEGISDLRDESDREGMRIVIVLKKDAFPQVILNKLYSHTMMQNTFGVINLALVNNQPRVLNMKETMLEFLKFREEVVIRRTRGKGPHPRGLPHRAGQHRRDRRTDQDQRIPGNSPRGTDEPVRTVRSPVPGDSGYAPGPPDGTGAAENRGRVPGPDRAHHGTESDSGQQGTGAADRARRGGRGAWGLWRRAPHDHCRGRG